MEVEGDWKKEKESRGGNGEERGEWRVEGEMERRERNGE